MSEDLFKLADGRYIASEEISKKMFLLKRIQPESYQQDSTGYTWDESGMADLFADCYSDDTRYCPERKSWYTYSDGLWRRDTEALLVSAKIREFVRLLTIYAGEIPDEDRRESFLKFVTKLGDRRFRDRLKADASSNLAIPASQFDQNPYLINCVNGTYDLSTLSFRPHDRNDFLTMQANFEGMQSQDARSERWEKFVWEVCEGNQDKIDYLQRALGYSIIGSSREECMFILHGKTTRNGKSTLLGTLTHLLGDYATVSPVSIICKTDKSKNAESASPTLARLKGVRFVTMAESDQYGRLDEETIKQMTGGEEITARNLYEASTTFLPQFTLWLSCNDLPTVRDKSLFASDRLRVIEFNRHFSEAERDETLKDTFREKHNLTGIFQWLAEGYEKYTHKRLQMSAALKSVVKQYERANDQVLMFLEEKTDKDPASSVSVSALYNSYKLWSKTNGYHTLDNGKFRAGIEMHPEMHEGAVLEDNVRCYKGIKLR